MKINEVILKEQAEVEHTDGKTYKYTKDGWKFRSTFGWKVASQAKQDELNALAQKGVDGVDTDAEEAPEDGDAYELNAILDDATQFRFPHPKHQNEDVEVIVRRDGWYLNKLPKALRGQVPREKNRLYKVRQPANIAKLNQFYDRAAELGYVKEEPADAL